MSDNEPSTAFLSEVEGLNRAKSRFGSARFNVLGFARTSPSTSLGNAAAVLLLLTVSACGLRPLYSGGESGAPAQMLRSVSIAPIEGKAGWLLRHALEDRMSNSTDSAYRLEIELDDQIAGFGVRRDDAITRERRTLRARYKLIDTAKSTVLLDATAGSDVGIDVASSEYATVAAENTALERLTEIIADQIASRIALYASRSTDRP